MKPIPVASLIACLLLLGCDADSGAARDEPTAKAAAAAASPTTPSQAESAPDAPRPGRLEARLETEAARFRERRDQRRRWWNDEAISTAVGIDAAARQSMDALYDRSVTQQADAAAAMLSSSQAYRSALLEGDLASARQAARARAEHSARHGLIQQELIVDLLEDLTPAQRQILLREHARRVGRDLGERPRPRREANPATTP